MNGTDFWVIFDTNLNEAKNFLFQYLSVKLFCINTGLFLLSAFLFYKIYSNSSGQTKLINGILFFIIFILAGLIYPFNSKAILIDFYKSYFYYYKESIELSEFYENRKNIQFEIISELDDNIRKTFVIVIGESANRNHFSLYNYPRCTNPKLQEIRKQLWIYDNVISPSIRTISALKEILTFASYENPVSYKNEASIIELIKDAGYKTYWIDKQGRGVDDLIPSLYRKISKLSDEFISPVNEPYDESVISHLQPIMKDTTHNKVIFIHLIGSHFSYSNKSPDEFKLFDSKIDTIVSPFSGKLGNKEKSIIDDYDASILYNDFVISSIIKLLQEESGASFMLYFSDHGEEIYDSQIYFGRNFNKLSRSMCEIPFIFWCNDDFKKINALMQFEPHRPYSTDDVIHSILDIMKINTPLSEEKRSIFSPKFQAKIRKVGIYYYDDL
jgi:heptose-I-phosphate ethanolaminephosphotransferase